MKHIIHAIIFLLTALSLPAQTTENGVVKEYHGKEAKTNLAGVELMVKGAPSTVSDQNGQFTLRFSTLKAGDKVDFSEIYKEGYVIFNKDALDAWRISGNGSTFTVVMCREADFRALKKKFYGIIENSYKAEYERQKNIAEQSIADALELKRKIDELKKDYDEKLGNINTYVELFSRIDRSEMDSIEDKALHFIETGEIGRAIETYEELQLSRQVQNQMGKWDAGIAMVAAGNNMVEQVKADLMTLVEKMQKQIGLYEMGGSEYNDKRRERIEEIIPILYRLNSVSDGQYSETLGRMIIQRSKFHKWRDQLADYREAAAVPSALGIGLLGQRFEMMAIANLSYSDSARMEYEKILTMREPGDSLRSTVEERLRCIPTAIYKDADGREFPFGLWGDDKSEAYLCGYSNYVSTHIEGDVKLPDEIIYRGRTYPVTAISYFAFGNNHKLRKVTLPRNLRILGNDVFAECALLDTVVAPPSLNYMTYGFGKETVITFPDGIEDVDILAGWYNDLADTYPESQKYALPKQELLKVLARAFAAKKDHDASQLAYQVLIGNLLECGDTISALNYAKEDVKMNGDRGELILGEVLRHQGDYTGAFTHYKKALKSGNPYAYNQMAYACALPQFGLQDFKKAHEYIDVAIEKCGKDSILLLNFYDTKGELFLMEGKNDDAERIYREITATSPEFYYDTHSVLGEHFSPSQAAAPAPADDDKEPVNDSTNIQSYVDLVQLVARKEHYNTIRARENFRSADYAEMLSIGIIAVQVLIKNKPPEQLQKYNILYIATAVSWAIRNEMQLRYEWYNLAGKISNYDSKYEEECAKLNIDHKQLTVLYAIYLNLKDLYYTALDIGKADGPLFKQIERYIGLIVKAKDQMDDHQREFVDFYLSRKTDVAEIEQRFDLKTIVSAINIIRECINAHGGYGYGIVTGTTNTTTGESAESDKRFISSDKRLQPYLDIVRLVADNEMRYVRSFGMNLDKEELYAIGILAVQVVIKKKTSEQLAQYNSAYLASAIAWAIRNELRIRYKQYAAASKALDFSVDDDTAKTRMMIYFELKDLFHNPGAQAESKPYQEISEMMNDINRAKALMTDAELKCAEYFFDQNSIPQDIVSRFSPSEIVAMLDAIKKACKDNQIIKQF